MSRLFITQTSTSSDEKAVPADVWIAIGKFLHVRHDLIPLMTSVSKALQREVFGASYFNSIFSEQATIEQKHQIEGLVEKESDADFEGFKMTYNRQANEECDKSRVEDARPRSDKCLTLVSAGKAGDFERVNWKDICIFYLGYQPQRTRGPLYRDISEVVHEGSSGWLKFCVLRSSDGDEFKVRREIAQRSKLLESMVYDGEEETVVPITNVNSRDLIHVLQWCEQHYNNPSPPTEKPLPGNWMEERITEWEHRFLHTDLLKDGVQTQHSELIDLIQAANFLDMKDLLDFSCAIVAALIKGKSPAEIREFWGIENDFTPEEEEKIREENRWVDE